MNFGNYPRKGSFMGGKANPGTGLEGREAGRIRQCSQAWH